MIDLEANRLAKTWIKGNQLRAEANRLAETWLNGNRTDVIATLAAAPPLTAAFLAATLVLLLDGKDADIARRRLLAEAEEDIDERRETP